MVHSHASCDLQLAMGAKINNRLIKYIDTQQLRSDALAEFG